MRVCENKPQWSGDQLVVFQGQTLALFSSLSAARTRTLKLDAAVVGVVALDSGTLVAALDVGLVVLLDASGNILQSIKLDQKIVLAQCFKVAESTLGLVVVLQGSESDQLHVAELELDSESCRFGEARELFSVQSKVHMPLEVSRDGSFVVCGLEDQLLVWRRATGDLISHACSSQWGSIASIAVHPTNKLLVTGTIVGQKVFWHEFSSEQAVTSSIHWHAHPVRSLTFTDDGSYLLSGGEEGVLVLTQVETGHLQFLPRLGASINHISVSPDGKTVAVSTADNAILMIGSVSFRIEKQIRGVLSADDHPLFDAPDKGIPAKLAPIHVNGKHHLLLYRSCNPVVQLFDSTNDEHVSSFPILQRNYISRKLAGQSELPKRLLQQLCSNAGGNWLVAAVSRYDESVSLRFFQVTRNSLVETSFAESSHKKALSCLVFHPSQDICISGSVDGFFKVWKRKSVPQKSSVSDVLIKHKQPMKPKDEKYAWECVQVGTYKGLPVKDACFSRDGSLIVVVFGNLITFWSFASGSLKETVMIPKELESGKIRVFFHGNLDLICCTDRGLFCIDLLSLKSKWSIEKRILACEASQDGSRFAVCLMDDSGVRIEVFVDKGDQPFMTHAIQDSEYFGHRETWASRLLAFVRSPNGWALNVLVRNSSLVSLTADQETASMELSSLKGSKQSSSSEMQTLLQGSQGQKSVKNVSKQQVVAEGDFRKVLDGPAYALPSVTSLFQNAVAKLLGKTEEPMVVDKRRRKEKNSDEFYIDRRPKKIKV